MFKKISVTLITEICRDIILIAKPQKSRLGNEVYEAGFTSQKIQFGCKPVKIETQIVRESASRSCFDFVAASIYGRIAQQRGSSDHIFIDIDQDILQMLSGL